MQALRAHLSDRRRVRDLVSVAPSSIGTQPIGETSRVSEGIFQVKLPVPFPLKFVASYLVEDRDGWTVKTPASTMGQPVRRGREAPRRLAWTWSATWRGLS